MSAKNLKSLAASLLGAALVLLLAGCEMSVNKGDAKGNKNVEINTPFGDLKVKDNADAKDTGLPVYPGATPKPSEHDNGKGNATVSLSVLSMKIVVLGFVSDDSPDKVLAWYRTQMKPMGTVVECTGSSDDVGNVRMDRKSDDDDDKPVSCDKESGHGSRSTTELKLGTERNQRVVAISQRKDGKGTEFALVRVIIGKGKEGTL
jgi:hypothetical protein